MYGDIFRYAIYSAEDGSIDTVDGGEMMIYDTHDEAETALTYYENPDAYYVDIIVCGYRGHLIEDDALYGAMFGDELPENWSEEELLDKEGFIEWAINEAGIMDDYYGLDEAEVRDRLSIRFDEAIEDMWRRQEQEVDE